MLRITNGPLAGRIWINEGEVFDAETDEMRGEEAFQKILAWQAGNFESLPAEPDRPRTIFKSYNALLLESAQALDESRHTEAPPPGLAGETPGAHVVAVGLDAVDHVAIVVVAQRSDRSSRPSSRSWDSQRRRVKRASV